MKMSVMCIISSSFLVNFFIAASPAAKVIILENHTHMPVIVSHIKKFSKDNQIPVDGVLTFDVSSQDQLYLYVQFDPAVQRAATKIGTLFKQGTYHVIYNKQLSLLGTLANAFSVQKLNY